MWYRYAVAGVFPHRPIVMQAPETRASLLLRIRDASDARAWDEFAEMYREIIFRMARSRGLQDADADDLVQQVMVSISTAIERFEQDPDRGSFRGWLTTIARRAIINALTRGRQYRGVGGTDFVELVRQEPAADVVTQTLSLDYRRETFRVVAEKVRKEVDEKTWQAFHQTVVLQQPVDEVARRMGRSVGSIHTARSRVMKRLRDHVAAMQNEPNEAVR